MSASLVGSEMCIRDSQWPRCCSWASRVGRAARSASPLRSAQSSTETVGGGAASAKARSGPPTLHAQAHTRGPHA
eukprot:14389010-Alexandrium_andersonii.AAC.1